MCRKRRRKNSNLRRPIDNSTIRTGNVQSRGKNPTILNCPYWIYQVILVVMVRIDFPRYLLLLEFPEWTTIYCFLLIQLLASIYLNLFIDTGMIVCRVKSVSGETRTIFSERRSVVLHKDGRPCRTVIRPRMSTSS